MIQELLARPALNKKAGKRSPGNRANGRSRFSKQNLICQFAPRQPGAMSLVGANGYIDPERGDGPELVDDIKFDLCNASSNHP